MLFVGLRPKESEQAIAAVIAARLGDAKIGEQGNPLRLGEEGMKLSSISGVQVERSECSEFDHGHARLQGSSAPLSRENSLRRHQITLGQRARNGSPSGSNLREGRQSGND